MISNSPEDKLGLYDRLGGPLIKRGLVTSLAVAALAGCARGEVEAEQPSKQAVEQPAGETTPHPSTTSDIGVEAPIVAVTTSASETTPEQPAGEPQPVEPSDEGSMWPEEVVEQREQRGRYADASPSEVAFAYAKAFAEADGETSCALKDSPDCNPEDLLNSRGQIGFMPTEVINIPTTAPGTAHFELPMQEEEWGVWCIRLHQKDDGSWKVVESNTPPPPEKCD